MGFSYLNQLLQKTLRLAWLVKLDRCTDLLEWTLVNDRPPVWWRTGCCCYRSSFWSCLKFEVPFLVCQSWLLLLQWHLNKAILAILFPHSKSSINVFNFMLDKWLLALLFWHSIYFVHFKITACGYFYCCSHHHFLWTWQNCVILVNCVVVREVTVTLIATQAVLS